MFVAIANKHIKTKGRLALVLPKTLLSGVSWSQTRDLINAKYAVDFLIVSHDPERWNFSESTKLSEVLLVATNFGNRATTDTKLSKTIVVNLWHNPTTGLEASAIASEIIGANAPDLIDGQGSKALILNNQKVGEVVTVPWLEVKRDWFLPCAFAQSELTRSAHRLMDGNLRLPNSDQLKPIELCRLDDLGTLGPDRRDIYDGFKAVDFVTTYPSFWGHDASKVNRLGQNTNKYLDALTEPAPGRHLRNANNLWRLAGNILIAERMRLNTQKLVA